MKRTLIAALSAAVILWVAAFFLGAVACDGVTGRASFYCCEHHGRATASGEIFNQHAFTAAVPKRSQFGTYRITSGGKSVIVRANDTGGFAKYGRVIDLSRASFERLAPLGRGVIEVCLVRVR